MMTYMLYDCLIWCCLTFGLVSLPGVAFLLRIPRASRSMLGQVLYVGFMLVHVGPKLAPCWLKLGQVAPCWFHVGSRCLQVDSKMAQVGSMLAHVGSCWLHVASCWPHVGSSWSQEASKWLQVASSWPQVASSWPQVASSWPQVGSRQLQGHFLRQDGGAGTSKYL